MEHKKKLVARRIVHSLIRALHPDLDEDTSHPLTVFISHTKLDIELEPRPVRSLLSYLTAQQPEKTWFDSGDIESGSRFAAEIERGVKHTALLAVATDSYSSRAWCRREVLFAKKHRRPVVVVNAIQNREVRSFPYAGNVPVVRWKGDPEEVIDLLLRENLKLRYAELYLGKFKRPDDVILPAGPELVTLFLQRPTGRILYPDPPFGAEEIEILKVAGLEVETPLERHSRENILPPGNAIALSVSEAEDLARFGLRKQHLDAAQLELSRYLLLSGVSLAYGGDLRADGYTVRLANLLRDPLVEKLRGDPARRDNGGAQLVNYIAWPIQTTASDAARLGHLVEVRRLTRPADVDEKLEAAFANLPSETSEVSAVEKRFGWARGLTEMRRRQVTETAAKVVVGGRIGSSSHPYKGRMPGVIEEVVLALRSSQPVYLIGAFGGCAQLLIDSIRGRKRNELTWEYHAAVPHSEELRAMYLKRGLPWDEYDDLNAFIHGSGFSGLHNGLTKSQNQELAVTRSIDRIVALLLTGLRNVLKD
ncbi:MAG: TIR domain-containing protein [Planctomycetes bacterium]|nr:TIR domain-containing protein [Planctomycetota bacterium]MCW8134432.1 TIR domain-containing protein [Planctomycetota bacterium]